MGKRVGVLAVVVSVLAVPVAAGARTKIVYAGGPVGWSKTLTHRYRAGVNSFLIDRVTIDAGDTVVWNGKSLGSGFHTVDIPKLGGGDLPLILPTGKMVSGVLDAAGNPFWFNGKLPQLGFNPALFAPVGGHVYDGTGRVDSGLPLGKPHDFAVRFTRPGVYKFYCDVHYGMVGYVVVRPKGKPVPTARQDALTLRGEEAAYVAEAKRLQHTRAPAHSVSLGASGPGGLEVFAMFPAVLRVKRGTSVTFFMSRDTRETHTATFGPASYLKTLAQAFGGPVPPAQGGYPSDPPGHIVLTPATHGNGFAGVGALDRDSGTPLRPSGAITFAHAGTYRFICLIHPFMRGTIIVK